MEELNWQGEFVAVKRKKKRDDLFFFPFPENKEDKEKKWAGLNFPSLFTLTAPNFAYL